MKSKKLFILFLIAAFTVLCACSGDPKLRNTSFDKGLANWEESAYYKDGRSSFSEDSDAERGAVAKIVSLSENDARLCQSVKVRPDTVYRISCMVRTENVTGHCGATVGVKDLAVSGTAVSGTSGWQTVELVGKTAPGQKTLSVTFGIGTYGSLGAGTAWFDDISIEQTDANATVLLGKTSEPSVRIPTKALLEYTATVTGLFAILIIVYAYFARKPLASASAAVVRKGRGTKISAGPSREGFVKGGGLFVLLILLSAFALRIFVSARMFDYSRVLGYPYSKLGGHYTDINCFAFWGKRVFEKGAAHFYESWCDYPPGYMAILGFLARLNSAVKGSNGFYVTLIKTPCIIADLACAYIIWRLAKKRMNRNAALLLTAVAAFTPLFVYVSAAWGQIDQILALFLLLPILLLYKRRPILAGLMLGIAVALKPQALMCGPLFAAACVIYIIKGDQFDNPFLRRRIPKLLKIKEDTVGLRIAEICAAVVLAFAVVYLVSLPFRGSQDALWILDKYIGTATSYKYASVNGYNFWAMIGANWKSVDTLWHGMSYGKWGTIAMIFFVAAGIGLYVFASLKHKADKGALPLTMAYTLAGIFTFGHYMHERYILPALILILAAYIFYNDRHLLWVYAAYSVTVLVNCIASFYYSELFQAYKDSGYRYREIIFDEKLIFWCSAANVVVFIGFTVVTALLIFVNKPKRSYNG